jgi:rhamnosyltransferase
MKKETDLLKELDQQVIDVTTVQKILFVVVLYKIILDESLTYKSLGKSIEEFCHDLRVDLLVCDNSSNPQIIKEDADSNRQFNIYYLHDSGNPGISLSYNRAAELASVKEKSWLLVMDQDTVFPVDAINKYVQSLNQYPNFSLYAPKVRGIDGLLLSPCGYKFYRGYPLQDLPVGINSSAGRNVINSGLLLDLEAYKSIDGYDERVWLYYSDFVFFNRLKKKYNEFVIVNCQLNHELSASDYTDYAFAMKRFQYYCEGAKAASLCDRNFVSDISYRLTVGMRGMLMTWRFKKISFFKVFLQNFF